MNSTDTRTIEISTIDWTAGSVVAWCLPTWLKSDKLVPIHLTAQKARSFAIDLLVAAEYHENAR